MGGFSSQYRPVVEQLATRWVGHPTELFDSIDSTNRYLKQVVERGSASPGQAVWADQQVEGRGRRDRSWWSPPGLNIYTSVAVDLPDDRTPSLVSLLAGVALVTAVNELSHASVAALKWPNDCVIEGYKFAGVLVEAVPLDRLWAVIGMGINVNQPPHPEFPHALSLKEALGRSFDRGTLWQHLMRSLEEALDSWRREGDVWVLDQWTRRSATLGQDVAIIEPGRPVWFGFAERVDADGGLWVRRDGVPVKIMAGDVSVRRPDGSYS